MKAALAAFALLLAPPAQASQVDRWRPLIVEAALRFGIPEDWIARVMQAESAGMTARGGRPITSRKGAMGLMQLMPDTWAAMRAEQSLGSDPYDAHDNIIAGTAYLRAMYDRYGYPGLFAAYNAGPGRYEAYLRGNGTLPGETRAYLAELTEHRRGVASAASGNVAAPSANGLFFVQRPADPAPGANPVNVSQSTLFVSLNTTLSALK